MDAAGFGGVAAQPVSAVARRSNTISKDFDLNTPETPFTSTKQSRAVSARTTNSGATRPGSVAVLKLHARRQIHQSIHRQFGDQANPSALPLGHHHVEITGVLHVIFDSFSKRHR
jgi:hypothetical protein